MKPFIVRLGVRSAMSFAGAVLMFTACSAGQKQVARTVLDVARSACELFAAEQAKKEGLSVEEVVKTLCSTEEDLRPWVDDLLASQERARLRMKAPADGGAD